MAASSSSSRPNIHSLPEQILIQILVTLPAKSLLQLRSTCKSWYSLITDRTFIDAHLKYQTSSTNNYLLLRYKYELHNNYNVCYSIRYDDESFAQYFQPELPLDFKNLDIYGSCNGLVCLSERPLTASSTIYLWNPALRILKTLPKSQIIDLPVDTHSTFIAFGFDYRGNDYKVVKFVCVRPATDDPSNTPFLVEVYSLSTDSWRKIDVSAPSCCIADWQPTIMNGAAYWTAYRKTEGKLVYSLLQFGMCDEVFTEVMLPEGSARCRYPCITVFGESLCLYNFGWSTLCECDVWTMECCKMGTWTKRCTVNFSDLNLTQIGFRRNGELLQVNHKNDLVSYNLENQQATDTGIHARRISYLHSYVESLVLLDKGDSFFTSSSS
ncbi:F-box protein CPR1-like [Cornus florida]|uniref:F-box protein CPR1-like n=1 Tax=Cornus florida TaxID=4283 RepID=UPI00289E4B4E|nr:F-box protein CPR1-like [Cornus florida]